MCLCPSITLTLLDLTMMLFCRFVSQVADVNGAHVNAHSNVGMFTIYYVLHYFGCIFCIRLA